MCCFRWCGRQLCLRNMPISGVNPTPRTTAVYASDPALPRRPQDSLPPCLLGFGRTRLALASSYRLLLSHPASGSRTRHHAFSRVTPSAVAEHFSELLGCPISRSLTACCVGLELRPLPSPGITRLPRYYEPRRHPSAPGLSLTGVRLIIPDHALGLPVLRALSLCTCCRHYPGAAAGRIPRSSHPAVSAFPDSTVVSACISSFSRFAQRLLTLRPAHSRSHQFVTAIRGLQTFRHLHACSGCFRLERIAGWGLHPLESAALSRRTWEAVIRFPAIDWPKCAKLRTKQRRAFSAV